MSLTKHSLGGNNDGKSLVSDIPAGDGNIEKFFTVHAGKGQFQEKGKGVFMLPLHHKLAGKGAVSWQGTGILCLFPAASLLLAF